MQGIQQLESRLLQNEQKTNLAYNVSDRNNDCPDVQYPSMFSIGLPKDLVQNGISNRAKMCCMP